MSLTACGGDSSGPSGDLDAAISMEIAMQLLTFGMLALDFDAAPAQGAAASQPDYLAFAAQGGGETWTFDETVPCQGGGTMHLFGTVTDNINAQGTGTASIDFRQAPNGCTVQTSEGAFSLSGNPDIRYTSTINLVEHEPSGTMTFSLTGGFAYTSAAQGSGSCAINLSYSFNMATSSFSMSGHVCGNSMNFSA